MDPQQELDALASSLAVIAGGGATPGALITARLSPDPAVGLVESVAGVTRTTFLLKMLRFGDDKLPDPGTTIADFLALAGQVLGGQAMPALNVQMPGPPLPGARIPVHTLTNARPGALPTDLVGLDITEDVPSSSTSPGQPSVGQASATNPTQNVLAGVPGIVGVIETGLPKPTPIQVKVTWVCTVVETGVSAMADSTDTSVRIVPPITFADLADSTVFTLSIFAKGTLTLPNPADPAHPYTSDFQTLAVDVHFPGISIPRLLGLFTWPIYGTEATAHDADPDDSSLLLMFPADAPLSGVDSVTSALTGVRTAVAPILTLVSGPLDPTTLAPFATPAAMVAQLTALLAGLDRFANRMGVAFHGAYIPVMTKSATAPTPNSSIRGGIRDLDGIWWDAEWPDHDYYHDHAKSFLWLSKPGGSVVIHRGPDFDPNNQLTLTTGGTCLVGIPHFRPAPSTKDPVLDPNIPGVAAAPEPAQVGRFTNEQHPDSEDEWAWTDSVEFL